MIDISHMRSKGLQPGEELLPESGKLCFVFYAFLFAHHQLEELIILYCFLFAIVFSQVRVTQSLPEL